MIDLDDPRLTLFPVRNKIPTGPWKDLPQGSKNIQENADVGLATGQKSGLVVIDVDDLSAELPGEVPETFARKTPRGGIHLYFQAPDYKVPTLTSFPAPGVDLRGDGGLVVLRAEGYEDLNDLPPAPLPEWMATALLEHETTKRQALPKTTVDLSTEKGRRRLRDATEAAKELPVGGPGDRDHHLWLAALHLVRSCGMPTETAVDLLVEHYCPRVSADGLETVSRERVEYKCRSAEETGTVEFVPWSAEDVEAWKVASLPLVRAERRERLGLVDLADGIQARPAGKLRAADMIPAPGAQKTSFGELCNILATHQDWVGKLRYDEFTDTFVATKDTPIVLENRGFYTDEDVSLVRLWLASHLGILATKDDVYAALCRVSKDNAFHPVKDYLSALPDVERPSEVIEDFAVAIGVTNKIGVTCVRKFLIGAVLRILHPGHKHDGVLVLRGPQGVGKSSLLYALSPNGHWVQESLPDLEHKDAQSALDGRWLVEIAELQAILKKSESVAKDFLTRQDDSYRKAYDRRATRHPRSCVFIATTNDVDIIRDPTGARRYWVVETKSVDLSWVRTHRDEIWAAALALAGAGEHNYLDKEEEQELKEAQQVYTLASVDPWEESVREYLSHNEGTELTLQDVYLGLHGGMLSDAMRMDALRHFSKSDMMRLAGVMRQLGWAKTLSKKKRTWKKETTT